MRLSGPEKRALELFSRLDDDLFERNETDKDAQRTVRKLALSADGMGTSVLKSDGLLIDNPRERRPKNYTRIEPDFIWQDDFIEVKDEIMGKSWGKLGRDSLNDQLRMLLLRMVNDGIAGLVQYRFEDLMPTEQELVERDLERFKKSPPEERYYVRWDEIISAIPSPKDNFQTGSIQIGNFQLPVRIVSGLEMMDSPKLYVLDNEMMNHWDQVLS